MGTFQRKTRDLFKLVLACALGGLLLLGVVQPAHAAAFLSIRQTILTQQRDRVLIGFDATIRPIGQVHSISADCDVHVPLITMVLFLPVLGEIKNACSMGPTRAQLVALGPGPMRVEGAFRIWFEGHDEGIPFREEDREVHGGYENAGPPHVVEVHPITRLGDMDLLDRVRFIERNGVTFSWKTGDSFRRSATRQLTIVRRTIAGRSYIQMSCSCPSLANHYQLTAEIVYEAHPTDNADGVVASGRVFDEDGSVILPKVRFFAVEKRRRVSDPGTGVEERLSSRARGLNRPFEPLWVWRARWQRGGSRAIYVRKHPRRQSGAQVKGSTSLG